MSGAAAARALENRFEAIRRAELERLHKKVAALSPSDREAVDAITAHVVHALVRCPAEQLTHDAPPGLVKAMTDLFQVS
jgi:glutamyl-tRNA reductase